MSELLHRSWAATIVVVRSIRDSASALPRTVISRIAVRTKGMRPRD